MKKAVSLLLILVLTLLLGTTAFASDRGWEYSVDPHDSSVIIATNASGRIEKLSITYFNHGYCDERREAMLNSDTIGEYTVSTSDIQYYQGNTLLPCAPKDVGVYTARITVGGATASTSITISPTQLDVKPGTLKVCDKTYDGTCDADVSFDVDGIASPSDDVKVSAEAKFIDPNVGEYKTVSISFSIKGEDSANYIVPMESNTNASILPKSINEVTVEAVKAQDYTGKPVCPAITVKDGSVTLVKDTDYTVEYADNTASPDAKVIITGIGNYTGTVEKKFDILCTVGFNSNGGSKTAAEKVKIGGTVTAPKNPTRDGYTFGGWFADEGLKIAWDFSKNTVTDNLTLFARWTEAESAPADNEHQDKAARKDNSAVPAADESESAKTDADTNTDTNTNTNTATDTAQNTNPDTVKNSNPTVWIVLACIIAAAAVTLVYIGKKKNAE